MNQRKTGGTNTHSLSLIIINSAAWRHTLKKAGETLRLDFYAEETPALLEQLSQTPEMQRLSDIGMHCGCEYACFPVYKQALGPYSRLSHSIGVSKIVWRFTRDIRQATAGLLHDISTPVFAHTIDFLNNDHMTQESTEDKTFTFIKNSDAIMSLLEENLISIYDICDYHQYPIADNDSPLLSADRLEYTFGNAYVLYKSGADHLRAIYDDLVVAENENGVLELCFRSLDKAKSFLDISLRNSYQYISDGDRFLMQFLADIIRCAINSGVLSCDDLYTTETSVISKLTNSSGSSAAWGNYTGVSSVSSSGEQLPDRYCVRVFAKKRYIDPLVLTGSCARRISKIDEGAGNRIASFLNLDFNKWLMVAAP